MSTINVKLNGRGAAASCLLAVPALVSAESSVRATGLSSNGLSGVDASRAIRNDRPTKALVAAAAQAPQAYAFATTGAGLREQAWVIGGFASGTTTAMTKQHLKMRAYRGLEPWKDPA
ncbi:hypothetical protein [Streptomyces boninensis]|uniref:hypothetical protein n=1 Tax=Streptomyces boninensis TaxID=2039455 RepID=UPI003B21D852